LASVPPLDRLRATTGDGCSALGAGLARGNGRLAVGDAPNNLLGRGAGLLGARRGLLHACGRASLEGLGEFLAGGLLVARSDVLADVLHDALRLTPGRARGLSDALEELTCHSETS